MAHDFGAAAFRIVQEATGNNDDAPPTEEHPLDAGGKKPNTVALGQLGGKKDVKARATRLTPEQRSEIARKAAQVRRARRSDI